MQDPTLTESTSSKLAVTQLKNDSHTAKADTVNVTVVFTVNIRILKYCCRWKREVIKHNNSCTISHWDRENVFKKMEERF